MKKLILTWLFGTDDIKDYMELLRENMDYCRRLIDKNKDHMETLNREKEELETIRKLLVVCENHGIDAYEEMNKVELEEEKKVDPEDGNDWFSSF